MQAKNYNPGSCAVRLRGFFLNVLLLLIIASPLSAHVFSNMIIFGDSLSDVGNNTWVKTPGRGPNFTHGSPITNLSPVTNTPILWAQYLANTDVFTHRGLLPSARWHGQNLTTTNVDYAWASAETGQRYINDSYSPYTYSQHCPRPGLVNARLSCVPSVLQQEKIYLANLATRHQHPGKQTLFFIWAGGNDVLDNIARVVYRAKHAKQQTWNLFDGQKRDFSWFPTYNLYLAVTHLMAAGVPPNHIFVMNLPDIAKSPAAIKLIAKGFKSSEHKKLALDFVRDMGDLFNEDLQLWLTVGIRGEAKPKIIDINDVFTHISSYNRFLNYRFVDTTHSCVHEHATPYCRGYVFFNDQHPTTYAGSLLAVYLMRQL
jgi:phospholipase/lecithinase/hemolysin